MHLTELLLLLNLLVGSGIPLLVGLVTTSRLGKTPKFLLHLTLAGVLSVLTQLIAALTADRPFDWYGVGINAVFAWLTGLGVYRGWLRGTPAMERIQAATLRR